MRAKQTYLKVFLVHLRKFLEHGPYYSKPRKKNSSPENERCSTGKRRRLMGKTSFKKTTVRSPRK